jgi:hypothetical protein
MSELGYIEGRVLASCTLLALALSPSLQRILVIVSANRSQCRNCAGVGWNWAHKQELLGIRDRNDVTVQIHRYPLEYRE